MNATMVGIVCERCGKGKEIKLSNYNKKLKEKSKFFCSIRCSSTFWARDKGLYENTLKNLILEANPEPPKESGNKSKANLFNYYIKICRNRKNKDFGITVEYLEKLWDCQQGRCAVSGIELELPIGTAGFKSARPFFAASLDRIDSNIGYVEGNVQFICLAANYMKHSWDNQEFLNGFDKLTREYIYLKYGVTI
jgi:hypothetical protein